MTERVDFERLDTEELQQRVNGWIDNFSNDDYSWFHPKPNICFFVPQDAEKLRSANIITQERLRNSEMVPIQVYSFEQAANGGLFMPAQFKKYQQIADEALRGISRGTLIHPMILATRRWGRLRQAGIYNLDATYSDILQSR